MMGEFIRLLLRKSFWKKAISGVTTTSLLLVNLLLPYSVPVAYAQEASGSAETTTIAETASLEFVDTATESAQELTITPPSDATPSATPTPIITITPIVESSPASELAELSSSLVENAQIVPATTKLSAINKVNKSKLSASRKKLSSDLLMLIENSAVPGVQSRAQVQKQMADMEQFFYGGDSVQKLDKRVENKSHGELVYVYISLKESAKTSAIDSHTWKITDRDEKNHIVAALVEVDKLDKLASLNDIEGIRTVIQPVVQAGTVTTQGDIIHKTDQVRSLYSQMGAGMKIGVISDGVNNIASSKSSGNLPSNVTVLSNNVGGDEGTAMLEIIHDMAPGASLYFHDMGSNTIAFNSAVDALVSEGVNIIVDDIGWLAEPFFEDGLIASHIASVLTSNNVIYISSAGNNAEKHYQGEYYNDGFDSHDFTRGGSSPNKNLYIEIPNNTGATVVLEWNDSFGAANNDYDLWLLDSSYNLLAFSNYLQDGNDDPIEYFSYTNTTGTAITALIDVSKYSGSTKTLEVFVYPNNGAGLYSNNLTSADSIFGHKAVPGVIAVGAIDASDPGNDTVEPYSSLGPVTINGSSPRSKPDISGIDCVDITGAGGFLSPFCGTSAAAPHIAGIVAQLWGKSPTLPANTIRNYIFNNAVDLGSAGRDNIFGYGRADALLAYNALLSANHAPTTSNGAASVNEDASVAITLSASDVDGNPLTYTTVTSPEHGSLGSITGNSVTYTPAANYSGSDSFTFKVNDGYTDSNVSTVSITVNPVNDRPVATPQVLAVAEDTALPITLAGSDIEGTSLIFAIGTPPTRGALGTLSGSAVTYTPAAGYNGSDSFTFTASDGSLVSSPATISLNVTAVNDAPALSAIGNKSVNELVTLTFTAIATDDSPTLTYSLTGAPVGASINPSTGAFTFTPTEAQGPGTYPFTVRVTDGTIEDTEVITVTVNEVNVAPTAGDVSVSTSEDIIKEVTLVGADIDLPSQTLFYQLVTNPLYGTLDTVNNGKVNYTPTLNYTGSDSFTYKVGDGVMESAPATVTITVGAVNDYPVAVDDTASTAEDAPLSIAKTTLLANDTDPDGTSPTVVSVSNAVHGIVTILTSTVVFSPDADYNGPASFDYTITDGSLTDTGTVIVTVTAINDPPVAVNDTATTGEDVPLNIAQSLILTNDTDKDGDSLTVASVANPIHGTVLISGANVVFTPEANYSGAASFDYTVSDGTVTDIGTVNVTITAVDDEPLLSAIGNKSVDELANLSFTATAADPDNTVAYSLVAAPTGAFIHANTGAFSFTPTEAQGPGVYQFTVRATGGTVSDDELITVTVNEVNVAPTAGDVSVTVTEDIQKAITLNATDSDIPVQTINYFLTSNPSHGTLNAIHDGIVDYTPDAEYTGSDSFTYKSNDGVVDSALATVTITVTAVNDRPQAVDDAASVDEDTQLTIAKSVLLANDTDTDGDTLTINGATNAVHGIVTVLTSTVVFSPDADYYGPASFDYIITDGTLTDTGSVSVTVNAINDAPVANVQDVTVEEDSTAATNVITLVGSDKENSALTFIKVTDPAHGTLGSVSGNQITYTPNADFTGTDSFTFKVSDGLLDSAPATVDITVVSFNDPPVLTSIGNRSVDELATLTFTAAATDSDSSGLNYSLTGAPTGAAIHATTGVFTWIPTESQGGNTYNFTVVVSDETKSDSEAIAVTVGEVNTAPIADAKSVTTDEDSAKDIVLTATDSDFPANTLSYSVVDQPVHGSVVLAGSTATYTPSANYNGSDAFTYKVNDGAADSNTANVSITVSPVNDVPTAENKTASTNEDTAVLITLSGTDTETATEDLQYEIATQPSHGSVTISGDVATYTPVSNYHGADSFTYKANDGAADSSAATVSVTVLAVNDAPIAVDDTAATSEDTLLAVAQSALLTNDTDLDGDTLSITGVAGAVNGTVNIVGTDITFTPSPNYSGSASFDYTVSDGAVTDTATVTVTVTAVNDAPFLAAIGNKSVDELSLLTFTVSATDPDSAVTYALTGAPAGAVVGLASGIFTFTPTEAQGAGVYGFTVSATDGTNTDTEAITVTVNEVNTAPVANDVSVTTGEDAGKSVTLSATDTDVPVQTINYFLMTNPAHGTLDAISNGTVNYTPNSNYSGADSFTYKVNDGDMDSNTATVTITVGAVNDAPLAVEDAVTVAEDAILTLAKSDLTANDTDAEDDTLTVTGVSNAAHGTAVISGANVVFTPAANYFGAAGFEYTVSDGGLTATGMVTVTVTPVNDTPVADDLQVTTGQEDAVTVSLSASDTDGDTVSYIIVSGPTSGTLSAVVGSTVTYTPSVGFHGTDTFTYKANDGVMDSNAATVTITVNPPPVISNEASGSVKETSVKITWTTDHASTSRVVYDIVSIATPSAAPNYGYTNSTIEDATKVTAHMVEITGLSVGVTYYYRVISHGSPETLSKEHAFTTVKSESSGNSGGSSGAGDGLSDGRGGRSACTDSKPGSAPRLTSAVSGTNTVTLTWTLASDPVSYYLVTYGNASDLQQYGNPNIGGSGTKTYTVKGLSGGTRYYFRVRAGNGCMPGEFSNELSATPDGEFIEEPAADFQAGVLGAADSGESATPAAMTETPKMSWWQKIMVSIKYFGQSVTTFFSSLFSPKK